MGLREEWCRFFGTLETLENVLEAVEVMANGWALVGNKPVPSHKEVDPSTNSPVEIRECEYEDCLRWKNFVRKQAMCHCR